MSDSPISTEKIMATQRDLDRQTLTVIEAAQVLGVNPRTIYEAIGRDECPAIRVGRVIRIPTDRFLAHYGLEPASHPVHAA